jgi:chromate transporter
MHADDAENPEGKGDGERRTPLLDIARVFLKLGTIGFGGPAAHIAMMEHEVVRRRQWVTREEFLDYVGATNLIPGPNSTELAIHIGLARAGWWGLLVAGGSFILPATLIVTAIASLYVRFATLPTAVALLYGVKPVGIAVVLQALWGLAHSALKTRRLILLAAVTTVCAFAGINELIILFAAGAIMAASRMIERRGSAAPAHLLSLFSISGGAAAASPFGMWPLFAVFVKIGSVLFGSGYVLLAFLRADLVERLHWLTERQLLDAVAVGQITPGPLFTTATFIGYVLGGNLGAAVATVGIFVPAFIFVAISGLALPRLRRSPAMRAALDGVNVASLGLMSAVTWQLARTAMVDPLTVGLAVASALLLVRARINSAWLVLGGAVVGVVSTGLSHG